VKASRYALDHLPADNRRLALRLYKTEIRALLDAAKDRPCARCRQAFPICCMQFDHLPGTRKRFNLSEARAGLLPRHVVLQELKKCEVVCANCHAIREDERRRVYVAA
jgi:hypothetical protein